MARIKIRPLDKKDRGTDSYDKYPFGFCYFHRNLYRDEITEWCDEYFETKVNGPRFHTHAGPTSRYLLFANADDAFAFKMRWA